jgi:hypothetical protein
MGYEPIDAEREAAMDSLYDDFLKHAREDLYPELYEEIVRDFTEAQLQTFYVANPSVVQVALRVLDEAKAMEKDFPSGAVVFACVSIEVCLREALFKPIIHGLVHTESAANLIMELAVAAKSDRFAKMLLDLLATHGGVDPRTFKRKGITQVFWEEIKPVRTLRNNIVHQGETATVADAALAITLATTMIEDIFPTAVRNLGLHLHEGLEVCGNYINCKKPKV